MNIEPHTITVSGLKVSIFRKAIKNLHLGVYPPEGRIRVAAPLAVSDDAVRLAVIGKLAWIKRQREKFQNQTRQSAREMVSGESHYFLGRRYRLRVVETTAKAKVILRGRAYLELHVRPTIETTQRERILQDWHRGQLRALIPPLLAKWEAILKVRATAWGIKRMKTKWGSCTVQTRRIWLNLELAKKPLQCLEYLIVHELIHLIERHHNDRFIALMDRNLPHWRQYRKELNSAPLANESWSY